MNSKLMMESSNVRKIIRPNVARHPGVFITLCGKKAAPMFFGSFRKASVNELFWGQTQANDSSGSYTEVITLCVLIIITIIEFYHKSPCHCSIWTFQ